MDFGILGLLQILEATSIPAMLDDQQPHHILITASLAGLATWPGGGPYAASKHAVVTGAEQVALALEDEPASITGSCPALVRTGMSEDGADPDDVAVEALDVVARGRFLVLPDLWAPAVTARTRRLVSGDPPQLPEPNGAPERQELGDAAGHRRDRWR